MPGIVCHRSLRHGGGCQGRRRWSPLPIYPATPPWRCLGNGLGSSSGLSRQRQWYRQPPRCVALHHGGGGPLAASCLGSLLLCGLAAMVPRQRAAGDNPGQQFLPLPCRGSVWNSKPKFLPPNSFSTMAEITPHNYKSCCGNTSENPTHYSLFTKCKLSCIMV